MSLSHGRVVEIVALSTQGTRCQRAACRGVVIARLPDPALQVGVAAEPLERLRIRFVAHVPVLLGERGRKR